MKVKYFILLLSFISILNCSKKGNKDSDINIALKDSLNIYIKYIENKSFSDEEVDMYNRYALKILERNKNDSLNRALILKVVNSYNNRNRIDQNNKALKLLIKNSLLQKDSLKIAYGYYFLGNTYFRKGITDSAFFYYLKSEKLFLNKNQDNILSQIYLNKSRIQIDINDISGAEKSATLCLKYSRITNDKLSEYDALTNLGIVSNETENFLTAIDYHKKAFNITKESNLDKDFFLAEISLNNIGNTFQNLKRYKEAIYYFNEALKNKRLHKLKPKLFATLIDNVAYSKFKLNDTKGVQELFIKSLNIRDSLQSESKIIDSKLHLSEFYHSKKDTVKAQKYANEALKLAKKTEFQGDLLSSLKQLAIVEHKNSAKYSKEYIKISDSLQQEERKSKDKFARIAFETDEIIQEKDKLAEQNRSLLYFFIGTLFVGLLLFVIRTQRAKNRELLLKQQQQKVNEEIYNLMISQQATIEENRVKEKKRIAQELHDGVLGRLFGARLNLDSLNRFTDEESITSRFNYLSELKNIEQDIREISHDLNREKYVLINNFVAIVSNLLEEQTNSFEPKLTSILDEKIQWDKVSNAVKINLYRILQESLQNINKYAKAKHISVEFKKDNDHIVFKIADDGIGFDVKTKKRGIGLQNMQSRVNECEGSFEIKSKKGKGTTTIVSVPIEKKSVEAS